MTKPLTPTGGGGIDRHDHGQFKQPQNTPKRWHQLCLAEGLYNTICCSHTPEKATILQPHVDASTWVVRPETRQSARSSSKNYQSASSNWVTSSTLFSISFFLSSLLFGMLYILAAEYCVNTPTHTHTHSRKSRVVAECCIFGRTAL